MQTDSSPVSPLQGRGVVQEDIDVIHKVMREINGKNATNLKVLAKDIVQIMIDHLDCIGGALLIVDNERQVLRPHTYSQIGVFVEKVIPLLSKPFEDHLYDLKNPQNYTARTVTEKKIFIGHKYEKFMTPVLSAFTAKAIQKVVRMKTIATSPTIMNGEVVGVLMIGFREKQLMAYQELLLKIFSDQCAIAINNAQGRDRHTMGNRESRKVEEMKEAGIFHEINTPLTIASTKAQGLKWHKCVTPEMEEDIDDILEQVQKTARINADFQEIQALESRGMEKLHCTSVCLSTLVEQALYKTKDIRDQRGIEVEWKHKELLDAEVEVDAARVETLFFHVLYNACFFNRRDDGPRIVISTEEDRKKGIMIVIAIADNGPGIPEEDMPYIFDMLYRVDKSRNDKTGGAGLGLAYCKAVAEAHGGSIEAESTVGVGTKVRIAIPLKIRG